MWAQLLQACPTLCNLWTVTHQICPWILQAGILEWVAMSSSRESSWPRNRTHICCVSCIEGTFFTHWGTWEAPAKDIAGLLGRTQKTDSTFSFWWIKFLLGHAERIDLLVVSASEFSLGDQRSSFQFDLAINTCVTLGKTCSTGEGNGQPLQYSCFESSMNSMKRQKDELLRLVGAQYATGDQWRNNSKRMKRWSQRKTTLSCGCDWWWMQRSDVVKSNIA